MIACVVVTDGRVPSTIEACIESARQNLHGALGCTIIDDSADAEYAAYLDRTFSQFRILHNPERRGLGGAVSTAWSAALATPARYVLHLEDDFVFLAPIDLSSMAAILDANPLLSQLVLKRNPVNDVEMAAGGMMEANPSAFEDAGEYVKGPIFSFNPFLAPRKVIELANDPTQPMLERDVTDRLSVAGYHFGVLGRVTDAPLVTTTTHRSAGYHW